MLFRSPFSSPEWPPFSSQERPPFSSQERLPFSSLEWLLFAGAASPRRTDFPSPAASLCRIEDEDGSLRLAVSGDSPLQLAVSGGFPSPDMKIAGAGG